MGKNQRHKKVLKSERSKIKLKATKGKTLPKGTNVTDVNFKIKPIVVLEQLKVKASQEALSKRKLSLKELLNRLNHHNANSRYDACQGMSEVLSADLLEQNLYIILQNVCKLVLDDDRKVRQRSIKLISEILGSASAVALEPFFEVLATYATCAMTSINKGVQEDSLLLVDAFLEHTPKLLVSKFDKMFTNFLTLISKLRSDSKLSRTLTLDLNGKTTTMRWRINVLGRLNGILLSVVSETVRAVRDPLGVFRSVDVNQSKGYVPLYKPIEDLQFELEDLHESHEDPGNKNVHYINVLLPLLYETWTEAVPLNELKRAENKATVIDRDAATILACVSEIFYLLWTLALSDGKISQPELRQLYVSKANQKLLNHFMNQFPYKQKDSGRLKVDKSLNARLVLNDDPKCVKENLHVCYMFCTLHRALPNLHYVKSAEEVLDYIKICLSNRGYVTSDHIEMLSRVLRIILFENYAKWSKTDIRAHQLLDNIVRFFIMESPNDKSPIFDLLCDVIRLPQSVRTRNYDAWVSKLPLLLLDADVSENVVDMLVVLAKQNNKTFLESLLGHLPQILSSLTRHEKRTNQTGVPLYIKVISIFYYIPHLPELDLQHFAGFIDGNQQSKSAEYLNVILAERSKKLMLV